MPPAPFTAHAHRSSGYSGLQERPPLKPIGPPLPTEVLKVSKRERERAIGG
uniref:Uncharacterized protein n=1 Tax=Arundo donax TaxID=35708 RepID=A0A0A9BE63_ARUDO